MNEKFNEVNVKYLNLPSTPNHTSSKNVPKELINDPTDKESTTIEDDPVKKNFDIASNIATTNHPPKNPAPDQDEPVEDFSDTAANIVTTDHASKIPAPDPAPKFDSVSNPSAPASVKDPPELSAPVNKLSSDLHSIEVVSAEDAPKTDVPTSESKIASIPKKYSDDQGAVFPNKEISQVVDLADPSFNTFHADAQYQAHEISDDGTLYHDTNTSDAKDTTSSDDSPAIQSLTNHSPTDNKSFSTKKELRTECNKSMPATRN